MAGGRKPTISNEDILEAFQRHTDPVLSTAEVAEEFDFSQAGILSRLRDLEEKGWLESKKIGNSNAWWLTERGTDRVG